MQDGCKVYMDSYMASNGSCFMVTWTIFKNHLLEIGLTQNQETMILPTFTTIDTFYFIMCEDPHEEKFNEIAFGWEPGHVWLHTTPKGLWQHYMILEVCWDGLWTLSFGLSQSHGHSSWLVCEVTLSGIEWTSINFFSLLFSFFFYFLFFFFGGGILANARDSFVETSIFELASFVKWKGVVSVEGELGGSPNKRTWFIYEVVIIHLSHALLYLGLVINGSLVGTSITFSVPFHSVGVRILLQSQKPIPSMWSATKYLTSWPPKPILLACHCEILPCTSTTIST